MHPLEKEKLSTDIQKDFNKGIHHYDKKESLKMTKKKTKGGHSFFNTLYITETGVST